MNIGGLTEPAKQQSIDNVSQCEASDDKPIEKSIVETVDDLISCLNNLDLANQSAHNTLGSIFDNLH